MHTPEMPYSIAEVKRPDCQKCLSKMGSKFDSERNTSTNTGYQEKLHRKGAKNGKFS